MWYYPPSHRLNVNVMLSDITFFMIFAVFLSVTVNIMHKLLFLHIYISCFISNCSTFCSPLGGEGHFASAHQILLKLVPLFWNTVIFFIFSFKKMQNFIGWWDPGGWDAFCAKFYQNWSIHCGDIAIFYCSRWRPSAILDLFGAYLDHPRSVLGGLYQCKIWLRSIKYFWQYESCNLWHIWMENTYSCPKNCLGCIVNKTPKGTSLHQFTSSIISYRAWKSIKWSDL